MLVRQYLEMCISIADGAVNVEYTRVESSTKQMYANRELGIAS